MEFGEELLHTANLLPQKLQSRKKQTTFKFQEPITNHPKFEYSDKRTIIKNSMNPSVKPTGLNCVNYYPLHSNDATLKNRTIQMLDATVSLLNCGHRNKPKTTRLSCPRIYHKVNINHLKTKTAHKNHSHIALNHDFTHHPFE